MNHATTILLVFLMAICSCHNKNRSLREGSYLHTGASFSEKLTFDSDSSLIFDLVEDSGMISTNCDYCMRKDSIFISSAQSQGHVNYLSISDTFLLVDKQTIVQVSTGDRYRKTGGFVSMMR